VTSRVFPEEMEPVQKGKTTPLGQTFSALREKVGPPQGKKLSDKREGGKRSGKSRFSRKGVVEEVEHTAEGACWPGQKNQR